MQNPKTFFLLLLISVLFTLFICISSTYAEMNLPSDLMNFYSQNISHMTVSNSTILLFDSDETQFYYMYYNPTNETLNITTTFTCVSKNCPDKKTILMDYLANDTTEPSVKKAGGIFIRTNQTDLGKYIYNLTIAASNVEYKQSSIISIEILSPSFFKQFLHNLYETLFFWK